MADRAAYRGANSMLSSGMPGCVQLPGANANVSLAAEQWRLNDRRLDDAIAFIRHAHSVGLWVIADVTTLWPLQGTVGYNGSDCCTTHSCPCYPNAGPEGVLLPPLPLRQKVERKWTLFCDPCQHVPYVLVNTSSESTAVTCGGRP